MASHTYRNVAASLTLALLASACVAPVGPVEVTRFHAPAELAQLGRGTIAIEAGPQMDGQSIEYRTFAASVEQALASVGYQPVSGADAAFAANRATIRFDREILDAGAQRSPVSVGVGGSTGSYGSGIGLGIGFNLGGAPKPQVATQLSVSIRRSSDNAVLWEGRALSEAKMGTPMAETGLSAAKLARALFTDFPGRSGETIKVP